MITYIACRYIYLMIIFSYWGYTRFSNYHRRLTTPSFILNISTMTICSYVEMLMLMALLLRHVLLHSRVSEHTPLECSRTCRPSIVRACPPAPEMILLCAIISSQLTELRTEDWGRCDSTTTCILASVLVLVWCCTGGAPTIARTGHPPATTHIALRSSRECRHL